MGSPLVDILALAVRFICITRHATWIFASEPTEARQVGSEPRDRPCAVSGHPDKHAGLDNNSSRLKLVL